jgi:hypothetical protein
MWTATRFRSQSGLAGFTCDDTGTEHSGRRPPDHLATDRATHGTCLPALSVPGDLLTEPTHSLEEWVLAQAVGVDDPLNLREGIPSIHERTAHCGDRPVRIRNQHLATDPALRPTLDDRRSHSRLGEDSETLADPTEGYPKEPTQRPPGCELTTMPLQSSDPRYRPLTNKRLGSTFSAAVVGYPRSALSSRTCGSRWP